jgi:hypothetical protein
MTERASECSRTVHAPPQLNTVSQLYSFSVPLVLQVFQSLVIAVLGSAAVALMWQFSIPWLTLWGVPLRIAMKARVMLRVLMPAAVLDAAYVASFPHCFFVTSCAATACSMRCSARPHPHLTESRQLTPRKPPRNPLCSPL